MISHDPKLIFIHVPKAAGSSIEFVLQKYSSVSVRFEANGNALLKNKHVRVTEVIAAYGEEDFSQYYSFAVARNPWARVVSSYFYLRGINHEKTRGYETVQDWIMRGEVWCRPICYYVLHNGELAVNQVLNYDNLDQEFSDLCQRFELDYAPLPRNNTSHHEEYQNYYDRDSMALVEKMFAEDIALFSFQFDG